MLRLFLVFHEILWSSEVDSPFFQDGIVPVTGSRRWIRSLGLDIEKPWKAWHSGTGPLLSHSTKSFSWDCLMSLAKPCQYYLSLLLHFHLQAIAIVCLTLLFEWMQANRTWRLIGKSLTPCSLNCRASCRQGGAAQWELHICDCKRRWTYGKESLLSAEIVIWHTSENYRIQICS